jgi:non-heme chloroperoxidase
VLGSLQKFEEIVHMHRREMLIGTSVALLVSQFTATSSKAAAITEKPNMSTFKTRDDVTLWFKDWGPKNGPVVVLAHGWPLNADSWDAQAFHLANHGYRVVVHDRRGHGRSSQPWDGNDMDHYADDLAQLIDHLGLRRVSIVGFSAGGGEVARFVGRHGTRNVTKLALISAVTPFLRKTDTNPQGAPDDVFNGMRAATVADRAQFYREVASGPFYGFNRPGAKVSQGQIDSWWEQGMMAGLKSTYDCISAFSEDFREDVKKFDRPTLVIHGSDDQIVPIALAAPRVAKLLPSATVKIYEGAPHGLTFTHQDQLNADLLDFLKS